jgi:hypothetical protein
MVLNWWVFESSVVAFRAGDCVRGQGRKGLRESPPWSASGRRRSLVTQCAFPDVSTTSGIPFTLQPPEELFASTSSNRMDARTWGPIAGCRCDLPPSIARCSVFAHPSLQRLHPGRLRQPALFYSKGAAVAACARSCPLRFSVALALRETLIFRVRGGSR